MKPRCLQRAEIIITAFPNFSRMAIKYKHSDVYSMYFCTFTCYNWKIKFSSILFLTSIAVHHFMKELISILSQSIIKICRLSLL